MTSQCTLQCVSAVLSFRAASASAATSEMPEETLSREAFGNLAPNKAVGSAPCSNWHSYSKLVVTAPIPRLKNQV